VHDRRKFAILWDVKLTDYQNQADLPNDVASLQTLLWSTLAELRMISAQNALMRKELFGKKSEKQIVASDEQLALDDLFSQVQSAPVAEKSDTFVEIKPHTRRKKHPGRNAIPENIKTERHVIDVCDDIKNCVGCPNKEACGRGEMPVLEEVVRTVIERKKAEYVKHIYVRVKRACPIKKDAIYIAEPPLVTPIEKGLAGLELLLFVILSKYQYHLPLYRIQRQIFHESRIWFARATMVGWIAEVCVLLRPVYKAMIACVKKSEIVWSDDSLVRRVTHDGGSHTSYMWVYLGEHGRIVVFDYQPTRSSAAPREFLKDIAPGTYFMSDALASYNDTIKRYELIAMACMMHIRREFVEAAEVGSHKEFAQTILRLIGQLYRIERFATKKEYSDLQRLELRIKYSAPVMAKIKDHLQNREFPLLPGSPIGKAINYALGLWDKAVVFLTRGDLPLDNGPSERAIRDLVIGRNNWLHVGSDEGGKRMAILLSIISTCKVNGIDIEQYLADVLMRLASRAPEQSVSDLTPIEWLKNKNGGKLPPLSPLYPSKN
jgi:transposase